jgi:nitrous oxidase accessory protein
VIRLLALALLVIGACQRAPRPLVAGTDACAYCRMGISDVRFGGELQSGSGRLFTFDAIECLASFFIAARERDDIRAVWVADYESSTLVPVDSAVFLRLRGVQSPMGHALAAFDVRNAGTVRLAQYGSDIMRWSDVVALMQSQQVRPVGTAQSDLRNDASVALTRDSATIEVRPEGSLPLTSAIAAAKPGARIRVKAGTYREPTLRITRSLTLEAETGVVLDGVGSRGIMHVAADDVTVRGFTFRNTGVSHVEDRAALRVEGSRNCRIESNRVERALFGIYLSRAAECIVAHNEVRGDTLAQTISGNGLHVWQSERVQLLDNKVSGHRDGIYFEFVKHGQVRRNLSERNLRYGLHFMFSDDCQYEANTFRANGAGVAVMYTNRVHMVANRFERNWGSSAYGLLLKDISRSEIRDNDFVANSVGLHLEGASNNQIEGNTFTENGWALRVLANAQDNTITHNVFRANAFDVGTNSRQNFSTFSENFWDRYRGYDLNRDGVGDVPFAPVRLFALVAEQSPASLVLLRSVVVDMLDFAERAMPVLTPATLLDSRPLMRAPNEPRGAA